MYFVTLIIMEDGIVDSLIGPFESSAAAMDWADQDCKVRQQEHPHLTLETTEELIMLADMEDDQDPFGFIWQVIQASTPVTAQLTE